VKNSKILIASLLLSSCAKVPISHMTLSSQTPTERSSESIGYYSLGCLDGGVSLPPSGPGYQVMRLSRGRFWGHPSLIKFLKETSKKVLKKTNEQILIGDLGHARGAPSLTGHNSHQTGLDVDIWFKTIPAKQSLDLKDREVINAPSFLTSREEVNGELWTNTQWEVLKTYASHEDVERIFINPAIKRLLCQKRRSDFSTKEMAKIRPWYRHDDHFHVRLKCPVDSKECISQKVPDQSDGCDESLDWWFTEEGMEKIEPWDHYKYFKEKREKLSNRCKEILGDYL
jgi:penicillin-insensitive murein endopeptidase